MNYSNYQSFTAEEKTVLVDVIRFELEACMYASDFSPADNKQIEILKSAYDKLSMFEPIADDVDEPEDLVWKSIHDLQDSINVIVGRLELLESEQDDLK